MSAPESHLPGHPRAHLANAKLDCCDFSGASLADSVLDGASLFFSTFFRADLEGASLPRATGLWTEFQGANLACAYAAGVRFDRGQFDGAVLDEARLTGARLGAASFRHCSVRGAQLSRATLQGADLTGSDLRSRSDQRQPPRCGPDRKRPPRSRPIRRQPPPSRPRGVPLDGADLTNIIADGLALMLAMARARTAPRRGLVAASRGPVRWCEDMTFHRYDLMIIAIAIHKGGVGKTTTAVNTAAALARRKKGTRCLVIDCDSQCSLTDWLLGPGAGDAADAVRPSLAEVLLDGVPARRAVTPSEVPGLWVLPSSPRMAALDGSLAGESDWISRLRSAVGSVSKDYDYILLDLPPGLGLIMVMGLAAADAYVVPVVPEPLAIRGVARFFKSVSLVQAQMAIEPDLLGIMLTRVDYRSHLTTEAVDIIRAHFSEDVMRTQIRVNVDLARGALERDTIFSRPSSRGAKDYAALSHEIIRRAKLRRIR